MNKFRCYLHFPPQTCKFFVSAIARSLHNEALTEKHTEKYKTEQGNKALLKINEI